jgi:amphi-Trp domain-containing protein
MTTMTTRPEEITMGKNSFEFARIASPEETAEYLTSLAVGLKRGEVSLESGERALHLSPASDVKLELKVTEKNHKGRVEIEIGWKRSTAVRTTELRVMVGPRAGHA